MDGNKIEIRNLECELSYREATPAEVEKGILGTITGRAICFNSESQILDEQGQRFREIISPEACTKEWLDTQDVKVNMLHDRSLTFGRAKFGTSGNAILSVDDEGVNFEVTVPNCDLGIRARELTKAGVYDGCSFEFWPDVYDVEEREGNVPLVRHTKFRAITAVTLGMDPAYLQTTLSVRELLADPEADKQKEAEEAAKREAEEAARREAEEQAAKEEALKKEQQRRVEKLRRLSKNNKF